LIAKNFENNFFIYLLFNIYFPLIPKKYFTYPVIEGGLGATGRFWTRHLMKKVLPTLTPRSSTWLAWPHRNQEALMEFLPNISPKVQNSEYCPYVICCSTIIKALINVCVCIYIYSCLINFVLQSCIGRRDDCKSIFLGMVMRFYCWDYNY
jgi:hypothetical protein